jgi:hypothetical protein
MTGTKYWILSSHEHIHFYWDQTHIAIRLLFSDNGAFHISDRLN